MHGFRFFFTPCLGFFSPFPHGTGSLSVTGEYLALRDGPRIFRQDSTCPALLFVTGDPGISSTGLSPCFARFSKPVRLCRDFVTPYGNGLFPVRSPLLRESLLLSFPPGTKMFQFPGFPPCGYLFTAWYRPFKSVGCPIRTPADLCLLTAPRSVSPLVASFIGSQCQGIRRAPLLP